MMDLRHKLALEVCQQIGLGEKSFSMVFIQMWRNVRDDGGYRLTEIGHSWLREIGYKPCVIQLTNETVQSGSVLLGLDRHLKAPYYLKGKRLTIFDSDFSTQLLLYGGDLKAYLDAYTS